MSESPNRSPTDLRRLTDLVARLRAPDGCPWDREQEMTDLRAYLLEEAHETAAAIDSGDPAELAGELGDLLFQVAFLTRLAEEAGRFRLEQVVEGIESKMVERHPHVFGGPKLEDAAAVREAWERRKLRVEGKGRRSLLDGAAAASMPALVAAYRLTQKAAGVGFDWPDAASVFAKLDEELGELRGEVLEASAARAPDDRERIREELGDLLFAVANLARHLEVDPEAALAGANLKFRSRFASIERGLEARGRRLEEATLEEMDELWNRAKREERLRPPAAPGS